MFNKKKAPPPRKEGKRGEEIAKITIAFADGKTKEFETPRRARQRERQARRGRGTHYGAYFQLAHYEQTARGNKKENRRER